MNLEQYEKAITDLSKVVEINPKDDEAYHNLSICYMNLKETRGSNRIIK